MSRGHKPIYETIYMSGSRSHGDSYTKQYGKYRIRVYLHRGELHSELVFGHQVKDRQGKWRDTHGVAFRRGDLSKLCKILKI